MSLRMDELEPALYAAWRKEVSEQCMLYERWPRIHFCWENKNEVRKMKNPLTGRTLYGCLRCMRAHVCRPERDYDTCPRIVDADGDEQALICPFSSERVGSSRPSGTHNGSFDQWNDVHDRIRDMRRPRELAEEDADPLSLIKQHRGNSHGYAWHLRRGASEAKDARTSRTMYRQADVAEENAMRKPRLLAAIRAIGEKKAPKKKGALPPPPPPQQADDEDVLAMPGEELPHIVLPQGDMEVDDAYLSSLLRPLCVRIATASPFPTRTTGTRPRRRQQRRDDDEKEEEEEEEEAVPRALIAPGDECHPESREWIGLSPYHDNKTLVPHQRHLLLYVTRFLKHYYDALLLVRTKSAVPVPPPPLQYAVFCDRLLWLYHRYAGDTAQQANHWRAGYVVGPKHRLWPDGEKTRRIFYTMLTRVLTSSMEARDKVTETKIPVWLPDPFLTACWRARLFDALPPIETQLLGCTEHADFKPSLDHLRDDLLGVVHTATTRLGFSPHTLHDFLHPTTGRVLLSGD